MSTDYAERAPPDMLISEREAIAPERMAGAQAPGEIAPELLIPLAARAHGDAIFPRLALGDRHAASALKRIGAGVEHHLSDRAGVYGVLARTHIFRDLAARFFARHPHSLGASLGCGLGHYFQWLDTGRNLWIDVDRLEVLALRAKLRFARHERRLDAAADLSRPGWWAQLALPSGPYAPPVVLICELVAMKLSPEALTGFLHEFERHAPPGSQLLFDAMFWLSVAGPPRRAGALRLTWGSRRGHELAAAHPRLALLAEHPVMEGYGWPHSLIDPVFRRCFGVPFYGIAQIGVKQARPAAAPAPTALPKLTATAKELNA